MPNNKLRRARPGCPATGVSRSRVTTSDLDSIDSQRARDVTHSINQRIFDTSLDLILVVDSYGTFLRISPSCFAIVGYRPEEMIGRSARDFLFAADLDSTRTEMRAARQGRV